MLLNENRNEIIKKLVLYLTELPKKVADSSVISHQNFVNHGCMFGQNLIGGKVINHCNRFSLSTRCYAGAFRSNVGPKWVPQIWENVQKQNQVS